MRFYQHNGFQVNEFNLLLPFILILPMALITGPFLPDLIISITAIYFIILCIRKKLFHVFKLRVVIFFILFYAYILLRSIFSDNPFLSLESSLFYFRFGFYTLTVIYFILLNEKFIIYFKYALLIPILLIIVDGYTQFITGFNVIGLGAQYYSTNTLRLSGMFGEEMIMGKYLLHTVPLYVALTFYSSQENRYLIIFNIVLLGIALILILITGERTSFVLFLMLTILLFLLTDLRKYILPSVIVISIISSLLIFSNPRIQERSFNSTINELFDENGQIQFITKSHQEHAQTALKMFFKNPFVGHGSKMFREKCKNPEYNSGSNSCSTHPHNYYLQLLAETGLIGIVPIISILVVTFKNLIVAIINNFFAKSNLRKDDYLISLNIIVFINVFPLAPSMSFFNNWSSIVMYLPIPFLLYPYLKDSLRSKII